METSTQLVSVIMPAYNAASTIASAIKSVLDQSHRNFKLLIVDDGSEDDTAAVVRQIDDPRIHFRECHKNRGPGAARNIAIDQSSGEWITLIDADDLWNSLRLEKLLAAGISPMRGIVVVDDIVEFYETRTGLKYWRNVWQDQISSKEAITELSLARYLSLARNVMQPLIPRQAIMRNNIRYSTLSANEDFEFYIRLLKQCDLKLNFIPHTGYYYRKTPGSLSSNAHRSVLLKQMLESLVNELSFNEAEFAAIETRISTLNGHIRYIPFLEAIRERNILFAIKLAMQDPWYFKEFIKRLPGTLPYRLHVLLNKGSSR